MLTEHDREWLNAHAEALDSDDRFASIVLPWLARSGLLRHGLPATHGGLGTPQSAAIEAIAQVATHSLATAFVFWGQRVLIHFLAESDNTGLRAHALPRLLTGAGAGASGLSNAMKFLGGIESLGILATAHPDGGWTLDGQVPWCTNLQPGRFLAAVAVARNDGAPPMVIALPSSITGLHRSPDLDLIALRGTRTAALTLKSVRIGPGNLISDAAPVFLPRMRPIFLGLQCGFSIGVARAALSAAAQRIGAGRHVLHAPIERANEALNTATHVLKTGVDSGRFAAEAAQLFTLRLQLNALVQQAVQLELQASGGRAYHRDQPGGFARRWRESAFIPIVTPSVTQLLGELEKRATHTVPVAVA